MSTLVANAQPGLRALVVSALSVGALAATLGAAPALAADPHEVSQAVLDKYNPAKEAIGKRDFAGGLKLSKECLQAAKSAYEKFVCTSLMYSAAGNSGNYNEAIEAGESLLAMGDTPAATKLQIQKTLATMYPRVNKIDKAIAMIKTYTATSGPTQGDWAMLAQLYAGQRNCNDGMPALEKALAGGRQPDELQLNAMNFCANQAKNTAKRIAINEELLKRFPKKTSYAQLVNIYETDQKIDDTALAELLRFGFDHDWLDDEHDYVTLANFCLDVGAAAEAQRVLERGIQKKQIKSAGANEKNGRLLEQAKSTAANDKKTLEQADAEARAGKNGDSDVRLGVRYFAVQQYDKAVAALQRGLQPDRAARIKRPDDANMVLGMALMKLKKNAEASKAFAAAKADPRMAAVAKIWLNAAGG